LLTVHIFLTLLHLLDVHVLYVQQFACLFSDTTITAGIWIHIILVSAFKIIPSELESLGKKVCVDDHESVFTKAVIVNSPTTASPAHKKVKQENKLSPKAKQNLFENVDVGDISEIFGIDSLSLNISLSYTFKSTYIIIKACGSWSPHIGREVSSYFRPQTSKLRHHSWHLRHRKLDFSFHGNLGLYPTKDK
jgi:hypothetical protein